MYVWDVCEDSDIRMVMVESGAEETDLQGMMPWVGQVSGQPRSPGDVRVRTGDTVYKALGLP